jgi:hypothetical protein
MISSASALYRRCASLSERVRVRELDDAGLGDRHRASGPGRESDQCGEIDHAEVIETFASSKPPTSDMLSLDMWSTAAAA